MLDKSFVRRHAKLFSFFGVLLVTSSLLVLVVGEARAVSVSFASPPSSVTVNSGATFTAEILIPGGQRIPVTAIDAVLEKQGAGRTDKLAAEFLARVRCPIAAPASSACPANQPLTVLGGTSGLITNVRFVGAFAQSGGAQLNTGYFDTGALSGTRTGYGYDTVSPAFGALGYGYGYGYATGVTTNFADGNGYGYGYGASGLVLRYEVTVSPSTTGVHYLTVIVQTGSGVIGELSSPFTQFTSQSGGGGGGGSGSGSTGTGTGTTSVTVAPSVSGTTATATVTTTGTGTTAVSVPLSNLNPALGTLTLNIANAVTGTVSVTTSPTPTEGAVAVPTGFGTFLYLSITPPAGATISSSTITFTLTPAQMGADGANAVTLTHFKDGAWQARTTTPGAPNAQGAVTFTATIPSFSAFAIVFDRAPPTVDNVRPPEGSSATTKPVIAASLGDNRGINAALTRMFVDGQAVQATVTANEILYTPAVALTIGTHTVRVEATDLSGLKTERQWTFTAAQAADSERPTITPRSPAQDGFTNNPRPTIAADLADNLGIDTTRVTVALDGVEVAAPGVTATAIRFTPAQALADGVHTVRVTATDTSGNAAFATWAFTVDTALPTIAIQAPAKGQVVAAGSMLRVTLADALSGIDPTKVMLTIDGQAVQPSVSGNELTYTLPATMAPGLHTAALKVQDRAGNEASTTWDFTTTAAGSTGGPDLVVLLGVIVLLAVIALGAFWYFKNKK
jgi:hypothetical protein